MILLEYDREKTLKVFGDKLKSRMETDASVRPEQKPTALSKIIEPADPSPNKRFVQWIVSKYVNGGIHYLEDMGRVHKALQLFMDHQRELPERDIGRYKTLTELESAVDQFRGKEPEVKLSDKQRLFMDGEAEMVYDSPTMQVAIPETHRASCILGTNTQWCTASRDDDHFFNNYASKGPLYIILLKKENKRWQLHINKNNNNIQFMDERDDPDNLNHFANKYPEIKKALGGIAKKHGLVPLMDDASEVEKYLWNSKDDPKTDFNNLTFKDRMTIINDHPGIFLRNYNMFIQLTNAFKDRDYGDRFLEIFKKSSKKVMDLLYIDRDMILYSNDKKSSLNFIDTSQHKLRSYLISNKRIEKSARNTIKDLYHDYPQLRAVIDKFISDNGLIDPLATHKKNQSMASSDEETQLELVRRSAMAIKYIEKPSEAVQLAAIEKAPSAIRLIKNPSIRVQMYVAGKYPSEVMDLQVPLAPEVMDYMAKNHPLFLFSSRGRIPEKYVPIYYKAALDQAMERLPDFTHVKGQIGTYRWLDNVINSYHHTLNWTGRGKKGITDEYRNLNYFIHNMSELTGFSVDVLKNAIGRLDSHKNFNNGPTYMTKMFTAERPSKLFQK